MNDTGVFKDKLDKETTTDGPEMELSEHANFTTTMIAPTIKSPIYSVECVATKANQCRYMARKLLMLSNKPTKKTTCDKSSTGITSGDNQSIPDGIGKTFFI